MEDCKIVDLYWARSEQAIAETGRKYGSYCLAIATSILPVREDAEESVNDTYMAAWNSMPPHRPSVLATFLGKLTRRISIDRWRRLSAEKRGGSTVILALEELEGCIPGGTDPEKDVQIKELAEVIGRFLETVSPAERRAFLKRYFELASLQDTADSLGFSVSKMKSMLHRIRGKLRIYLRKEGY